MMEDGGSPLATAATVAALAVVAAIAFGWLSNNTPVAPKPLETAAHSPPLQERERVVAIGGNAGSTSVLPAELREPDSNSGESVGRCVEAFRRFLERNVTSDACQPARPFPAR